MAAAMLQTFRMPFSVEDFPKSQEFGFYTSLKAYGDDTVTVDEVGEETVLYTAYRRTVLSFDFTQQIPYALRKICPKSLLRLRSVVLDSKLTSHTKMESENKAIGWFTIDTICSSSSRLPDEFLQIIEHSKSPLIEMVDLAALSNVFCFVHKLTRFQIHLPFCGALMKFGLKKARQVNIEGMKSSMLFQSESRCLGDEELLAENVAEINPSAEAKYLTE